MFLAAVTACAPTPHEAFPTAHTTGEAVLEITAARRTADATGATVEFTEWGLNPRQTVTIVLVAEANSRFSCLDRAGRVVPPTLPLIAQVSELDRFHADASGSLRGALTVGPPPAAQVPCPPGTTPRVAGIALTGLRLSDVTDRVEVTVPGV